MPPRKTRNPGSAASKGSSSKRRATTSARATAPKPVKLGARQGGLQFVTKFPLDVLYEIFRLLHPRDLLALSRTDQSLRAVLLNRAAASVWKEALASTEIPQRPEDISLPRYASLAFDTHCEICERHKAGIYHWSLRLRLCRECSKKQLVDVIDLVYENSRDYREIDRRFRATVPTSEHINYLSQTLRATYTSLRDAWRVIPLEEVDAYFEDRKNQCDSLMEHARRCSEWQFERSVWRSLERRNLRGERAGSIVERLQRLGFTEELEYDLDRVLSHPAVAQPRALTDRIWHNIEPALLTLMHDIRKEMDLCERQSEVRTFLRGECLLREDVLAVLPDIGDMMYFLDVASLLITSISTDSHEYARRKEAALESFPAALKRWRRSLGVTLYDYMHETTPKFFSDGKTSDEKIAFLNLATTMFDCGRFAYEADPACRHERETIKAYAYPYILAHVCNVGQAVEDVPDVYIHWRPDGLQFCEGLSYVIADLVRLSGLDPDTATRADMDARDARIVCQTCMWQPDERAEDSVGTWWTCIQHWSRFHRLGDGKDVTWLRLGPAAEALVRELSPPVTDDERLSWRCMRCTDPRKAVISHSWDEARLHALRKHHVVNRDNIPGRHFLAQDGYASTAEPISLDLCEVMAKFAKRSTADNARDIFVPTYNSDYFYLRCLRIGAKRGIVDPADFTGKMRTSLEALRNESQLEDF
ncbi:hypothetical protein AURDEDRAFT_128203 [Auricularia subglabra TFB-10046 SS5]|uniref:F-box domain-containing protein n=1 Tax=Auricularia subglabra (strain TFB-10046 / SS5) TaxID=717982 RepID=J0WVZ2_AURST|nr:hypothetical protein AURDEDRAFT_128203 [Auricularia subglabra TFB-10046 SS5]